MSPSSHKSQESWRAAAYAMVLISMLVFLLQRTSWVMFDAVFELCIFHIPALFSVILYIRARSDSNQPKNGK